MKALMGSRLPAFQAKGSSKSSMACCDVIVTCRKVIVFKSMRCHHTYAKSVICPKLFAKF